MGLHFACTQCGKCCRALKLPLTVPEAQAWLEDGHDVQLLCDAVPWPLDPAPEDRKAAHRGRRSFATMSGSLPTRVVAVLAANLAGACPNLQADLRCGIYERRPLVCRIYPAEINPFVKLDPTQKACPPEAWTADHPLLQRDGRLVDATTRRNIELSRKTDVRNTEVKRRLCAALHLDCAALADEGFVVYSPERSVLQAALDRAVADTGAVHTGAVHTGAVHTAAADRPAEPAAGSWRIVSNQTGTIDSLTARGAVSAPASTVGHPAYEYIGFLPPSD
jgi:Fe-S-cluster containining protein